MVVIGAGVMPDVMLARGAGLELGEAGGVKCSSRLETSVPGIYAAGDICEYDSVIHGRHLRVEHWDVAFNHGKTAALNMLGRDVPHDTVPYFFSDLADWSSMEYVGPGSGEPVIRGSLDDGGLHGVLRGRRQGDGGAHGGPVGRPRAAAAVDRGGGGAGPGGACGRVDGPGRALSSGAIVAIPLGDRLMARRRVLVPVIGVRVPVPQ